MFGLWDFVDAAKARHENWGSAVREKLRQGNLPGYHLLDDFSQDGVERPLTVVDFHEVYSAPTVLVRKFAETCGGVAQLASSWVRSTRNLKPGVGE